MKRKKGIIFDMDGTLWDASKEIAASWGKAIQNSSITDRQITDEDLKRVMGKPMNELMEILFPELTASERKELLEECCAVENEDLRNHGAALYDGIEELFATLQKEYFLAIVSNCQEGYIEAFLEYYGFEAYIDDLQCFGMNQLPKSENIRLVKERNQLEEAVYIGDIQADYEASMAAGVSFIHAAYGFGKMEQETLAIAYPLQLTEILLKLKK